MKRGYDIKGSHSVFKPGCGFEQKIDDATMSTSCDYSSFIATSVESNHSFNVLLGSGLVRGWSGWSIDHPRILDIA